MDCEYECGTDDIYVEKFTGRLLHERPELSRLRALIRSGYYQAIAVYCLDRLSRDPTHLAVLWDECEVHSCSIISATEDVDSTPEGVLIRNIRGYASQVERLKIVDRTQRGVQALLNAGKLICTGKARYGYQYDKVTHTRVIHEPAAAVVRRIFTLAAQRVSVPAICRILNSEGIPTVSASGGYKRISRRWGKSTVINLIRDPSYYGEPMSWGKSRASGQRYKNGQAKRVPTGGESPIGGATPAIVDKATWDTAQGTIDFHRTYASTTHPGKKWRLLAGMIKCGCGATLSPRAVSISQTTHADYYVCMSGRKGQHCGARMVRVSWVEQEVWNRIINLANDNKALERAIERARGSDTNLQLELESVQKCLSLATERAQKLVAAMAGYDDPVFTEALKLSLDGLQQEVAALRVRQAELEDQWRMKASVYEYVKSLNLDLIVRHGTEEYELDLTVLKDYEDDEEISPQQQRDILLALGCQVVIENRQVKVELSIPLVRSATSASRRGSPGQPRLHE
jgi:site-specific DNA recombinase